MSADRINARLPEKLASHVAFMTGDGAYYENSSEYIRDLIRKDMVRAAEIAHLRAELEVGRKSGLAGEFDPEEIIRLARERHPDVA